MRHGEHASKLRGSGSGDRERALAQGLGRRFFAWLGLRQDPLPSGRPPERLRSVPRHTDGVLDPKTGQLDLVDHQIAEAREVIPTLGGALLIPTGDYYAPTWIALDPGKPGTLWSDVLKNYDAYDTLDGRLVASRGDRITLLA